MSDSVAAVVVTFNRKDLLCECISGLLQQTRQPDRIIVIDNNSSDGTPELVGRSFLNNPKLEYLRMPENLGGAGGFSVGIQLAQEAGFAWIWIMDDDAEPEPDCLAKLLDVASREKAGGYCPAIFGRDNNLQSYHHKVFDSMGREQSAWDGASVVETLRLDANAFVGPMFASRVLAEVGLPNTRLVSQGDDTEFTLRICREAGLLLIPDARIRHKDIVIQGTRPKLPAWKIFYLYRNRLWLLRQHFGVFQVLAYGLIATAGSLRCLNRSRWPQLSARLKGVWTGLFTAPIGLSQEPLTLKRSIQGKEAIGIH